MHHWEGPVHALREAQGAPPPRQSPLGTAWKPSGDLPLPRGARQPASKGRQGAGSEGLGIVTLHPARPEPPWQWASHETASGQREMETRMGTMETRTVSHLRLEPE